MPTLVSVRPRLWAATVLALIACHLSAGAIRADGPAPSPVDFNRQVRPILSENCFACHGPDAKKRKADLRLDRKASALGKAETDLPVVNPGHADECELIARVTSVNDARRMPPVKSGKKLADDQIELLRRWIDQGAPWPNYWAFTTPKRPDLPKVKDIGWVRNPIDRFILARLEAEGLRPSPEADKTTLIRRVTLDLTGLPPTPEEIDAFLADASPEAYEKVVDRLLRSPRYGERMAMQWLDGARYADSNGYQADYERFMWPWRDWVIDAYNKNMPFDQFTVEQLAGDLLPDATVDQRVATGFNRNHRINTEGGIIAEEWRVETVIDRVEATSNVWLGLTMGCARCHDHKYDPITQKEFYQVFAFFNNVPESGVGAEQPVNHPPLVKLPRLADRDKLHQLQQAVEQAAREKEKALEERQAAWEKTAAAEKPVVAWTVVVPTEAKAAGGAAMTVQKDGSVLVTGKNPERDTYTISLTGDLKEIAALRLEALPDDALAGKGPGRSGNGNIVLTDVRIEADGKEVKIAAASADFSQVDYPVAAAIDGDPKTGWAVYPQVGVRHWAVFALEKPIAAPQPVKLTVQLDFQSQWAQRQLGAFRLALTDSKSPHDAGGVPPNVLAALTTPADKRTDAQKKELADWFRAAHGGEIAETDRKYKDAVKARDDLEAGGPTVMVMAELPQPRDAFVLVRGQYDKHGDKVTAGLPAALPPMPEGAPVNRLGLAKWIVDPNNPLTARVAVNRFWERFFGVGLVKTTENFGSQGEPPSHPELLDFLAVEFVSPSPQPSPPRGEGGVTGWDMKAIQKTIVMSAAYRQSSKATPELLEKDPDNRLLARGPRFRLQAEAVRDNALAISGLLVDKVGGPSVRPYQPQGVWDETNVYGNLRNYKHDLGEGLYRRSMYTIWKRTAAPPTMLLFDSPLREVCMVKRSRTDTPLQALALLNEVTFVEASRVLAERMLHEGGATAEERIAYAFRRAVARKPTEAERKVLTAGLERRLARYRDDPAAPKKLIAVGESKCDPKLDPIELAAYTMTASVILNLDETITKE